jgi:hypothetical protein
MADLTFLRSAGSSSFTQRGSPTSKLIYAHKAFPLGLQNSPSSELATPLSLLTKAPLNSLTTPRACSPIYTTTRRARRPLHRRARHHHYPHGEPTSFLTGRHLHLQSLGGLTTSQPPVGATSKVAHQLSQNLHKKPTSKPPKPFLKGVFLVPPLPIGPFNEPIHNIQAQHESSHQSS